MKRGEIYMAVLEGGENVQRGLRPVVIVQNDTGNLHSPTTCIVPITSKIKKPLPTHVEINHLYKKSYALCEQVQTVNKKILSKKIGHLDNYEMGNLNNALKISLAL